MTETNLDVKSDTADREMVATRVFDAPRELVFKAWTDPDHLKNWWGPRGFTTTTESMDMRPGGVWRLCMHGPDGTDYHNRVTYLEVVEPERIVFQNGGGADGEPVNHTTFATFEDVGGKTRLTMRLVFATPAHRAFIIEKYKADEGLGQTMDRLGEYTEVLKAESSSKLKITLPSDLEIVLTRTFDAPRRLLWEAVTKPEHVQQWWGCYGMTLSVCEIDFRVGGKWRFVFRKPDGTDDTFKGEYLEIVPPEKVVQTFIYDVEFIRDHPSIETMTLNEREGKTTLQVVVLHKTKEARDGHLNSGMEGGAAQTYDRLAAFLTTMS